MKYLITGSGGFIGKHLMNLIPEAIGLHSKDCDIRNYNKLENIFIKEKPTHVIHLAAIANRDIWKNNPKLTWEVNVNGTENVLKAADKVNARVILMSTCQVYKTNELNSLLNENSELKQDGNIYVKTKLELEKLGKKYGAIIIRVFNQEGPERPRDYFTSKVILAGLKKINLNLWNPYFKREFMDVRDGVRGIKLISEKGKAGEVYNLSNGSGLKKIDFIKKVEEILGKKISFTINKNDDESVLIGDNTKLKRLGWVRKYFLDRTIKDQITYLTINKRIKLMKSTFYQENKVKKELCDFIEKSSKLSMGVKCKEFEQKFAKWQGRRYAVLYNSGSSANLALLQALLNMNLIKKGDNIGFSSITWATNIMPIIQLGLNPIPIDVSLETLNVNSKTLKSELSNIKLLFITNLLGFSSDLDEIKRLCDENNVILIEDNCESLGSELNQKKLGNFGLASTFSFFVGHHMSTIEGGMVCTDNKELNDMLLITRAHGWTRDASLEKRKELSTKKDDFYEKYTFYYLGYNLRPTEITGFIGLKELEYLDEVNDIRRKNYELFNNYARNNPDFIKLKVGHMSYISNFAYPLLCKNKRIFNFYKNLFEKHNIEIRPIVGGSIIEQPFFKDYMKKNNLYFNCPNAKLIHENGFYLPNNPELTDEEKKLICNLIKKSQ